MSKTNWAKADLMLVQSRRWLTNIKPALHYNEQDYTDL